MPEEEQRTESPLREERPPDWKRRRRSWQSEDTAPEGSRGAPDGDLEAGKADTSAMPGRPGRGLKPGKPGKAERGLKRGKPGKQGKLGNAGRGLKPGKAAKEVKPGRVVQTEAAAPAAPAAAAHEDAGLDQPPPQNERFAAARLRGVMRAVAAVTVLGMLVISLLDLEASSDFFLASAIAIPVLILAYLSGPGGAVTGRSVIVIFALVAVGEGGALYALAADSSNPASVGLAVGGFAGIALLIVATMWARQRPPELG